ncbi:MAG: hypothetical protein M3Q98_10520 [Actinomycetota bacterium]|nr:hypothetical protein [Actinomycetota bacterium]
MRFAGVAAVLCLVLAGCGGGDSPEASPTKKATTKATPTKATVKPTVASPTGVPAPEDLTDFQCAANKDGEWNATGILRNESRNRATYQVTVFVGEADGKDAKAMTKRVESVLAGGSSKVEVSKIPADEDAGQCYVQVLRKQ